jgi:chromosomal replication initiator protein
MLAAAPYAVRPVPVAPAAFAAVPDVKIVAAVIAGATVAALEGPGRTRKLARARWAAMLVMRDAGMSLPQIGRTLGHRDHSTVLHGLRASAGLMTTDRDFAQAVRTLRATWAAARSG